MLTLAGCADIAPPTTPVGTWIAAGEDHGTLTISENGSFVVEMASFNPITGQDANDNFGATGTWRQTTDDRELILNFVDSHQGSSMQQRVGIAAPFSSGIIRFQDPDNFSNIEFRLVAKE